MRRRPLTFLFLIAAIVAVVSAQGEWTAGTFPNPTAQGFKECLMKTTSSICDPDGVLSEQARYKLNHELNQLESRTRQEHARTFCDKKGITGAIAVAKHFKGGSEAAVRDVANSILKRWDLDHQCKKVVIIVMATEDKQFWIARGDKVPVYGGELNDLFNDQKPLFRERNFDRGLQNVVQGLWEKTLAKVSGGTGPVDPRPDVPSSGGGYPDGGGGRGGGAPGKPFEMPNIPIKLILGLVALLIPLLCCCACIYCCCCRGKGGDSGAGAGYAAGDPEGGENRGGGGRGGGGLGGLGTFLSSGAGSAAASAAMNFFRNRNRGGGGAAAGGGGSYPMDNYGGGAGGGGPAAGGYTPGSPVRHGDNPSGKGYYPSDSVKDQGGGGGW
uniref:TPM_phosphatase domain-containing protein n=1 Tax=Panagrellus redivivus TaxID=6233 RepID=A0A7E4WCD5_PANRE